MPAAGGMHLVAIAQVAKKLLLSVVAMRVVVGIDNLHTLLACLIRLTFTKTQGVLSLVRSPEIEALSIASFAPASLRRRWLFV